MRKTNTYKGITHCAQTEEKYGSEAPEAIVHPVLWLAEAMADCKEYVYRKDGEAATADQLHKKIYNIVTELEKWPSNVGRSISGKVRKLDCAITQETFQDVLLALEKEFHPENTQKMHQCLVKSSEKLFSKLEHLFANTAERWIQIRENRNKPAPPDPGIKDGKPRGGCGISRTYREIKYVTKPITSKLKGILLKEQRNIIRLQSEGVDFDDAAEAQWVLNNLLTNINSVTEALNDRS